MKDDENQPGHINDKNKSDVDHKMDQANGNLGDPSAKRNIGLNNATQRDNQKDELENLHIAGNETTGYGDNTDGAEENASGPGFEAEGSEFSNDHPVKEE